MKKAVMIVAQENFRDEELLQPKRILQEAGIDVKVASWAKKEALGMLGARVIPDLTVQEIDVQDFDVVVFVGGTGAIAYWDNTAAHKIACDAYSAGKIVTAICSGPVILARAGLLKGKKATVFSSAGVELSAAGAIYTAKAVEKDGNVITASGPQAATDFGNQIVKALSD